MAEHIDYTKIQSLTDFSYKTVRKRLEAAGVKPVGESGKSILFDSAAALAAVFSTGSAEGDLTAEKIKLTQEQSRKLSRENDIEEGKVAPLSILHDALVAVGQQIVSILEALPLEMKRSNPRLAGHDIMVARKAIHRACNAISAIQLEGYDDK